MFRCDNQQIFILVLKANTAFLNSLGRGATFKEISKAIVSEIEINVPSLSEQENAVANLEEISKVVTLRRQQLTLLDDLKKPDLSRCLEIL